MSSSASRHQALGQLCPALLPQVHHRLRTVRGDTWAFLENALSGRQVRLNATAWALVRQLDGRTRLDVLAGDSPTAIMSLEEAEHCLQTLTGAGMLSLEAHSDTDRLIEKGHRDTEKSLRQRFWNPLAVRIPLHNPNDWLTRLMPWCQWLFTRTTALCLCVLLLAGVSVTIAHHEAISQEFVAITDAPARWWLLALLYPFLKAVHEFAHALCIRYWGGEVNEVGITFLVLMPVPHVDASAATLFAERHQRILVSAAGMIAEGTLAVLALLLWCLVEPGLVRDLAFATVVTGSVSTLLFNANPLLRFDGYYMLQDWLDIPNLATRAISFYRHQFKRHVLRLKQLPAPLMSIGERRWLLLYAPAAWVYRWIITLGIALFLAQHYFFIGSMLAMLALVHLAVLPTMRGLHYLRRSPELRGQRGPAAAITAALALCVVTAATTLPLPASTRTQGVVTVPDQAQVFAPESGEVLAVLASVGDRVGEGQLLIRLSNPDLEAELATVQAQRLALQVSRQAALQSRPDEAQRLGTDLQALERREQRLQDRIASLEIRSPRAGLFAPNPALPLTGRWVDRGDLLGYSVDKQDLRVTAVIRQQRLGEVNHGITRASVRLAERLHQALPGELIRQTPAGSHRLPSPALADGAHGGIAVARTTIEGESLQTLERVFQIELRLPTNTESAGIGGRAYVTLQHRPESLASRVWRATRQLLLSRLAL